MEWLKETLGKVKNYFIDLFNDIKNINKSNIKEKVIKIKYPLILALLTLVFLFIFNLRTSERDLLRDLEVALKKGNAYTLRNDVKILEDNVKVRELKPLVDFYEKDTARINNVIKELREKGQSGVFTLVEDSKLFVTDYYLEINAVAIKIKSNFDNASFYINNEKIPENNVKRALVPGIYEVRGELNTEYGKVEKKLQISAMKNEEISIDFDAVNINLTSNFNDSKVFINGKDTNKLVKDIKSFGPIPSNLGVTLSLQREFPWGIVKSEDVIVKDIPDIKIDLNMVNESLVNETKDIIQRFYESVFLALNSKDESLIILAHEETKGKIYNELKQKAFLLKNNYEIGDLETNIQSSEFKYEEDNYVAQIVVKLNYKVYKSIFTNSKKDIETILFTRLKYVNNQWLVDDVQKVNLDNQGWEA
ncbi:TcaA 3rd/4th domain-containing protein [Clostridium sp.]|uniref:TcaA 3rd/4th domain-containing protein n=1 Tax=Clostridium sp. TaxID=1506 RepID=UPI003F41733D